MTSDPERSCRRRFSRSLTPRGARPSTEPTDLAASVAHRLCWSGPSWAVPVAGADRFGVVVLGDEITLGVCGERQRREGACSGAEDGPASVEDVKCRLVARAQQLVTGRAVEPDRATGVRTDLGVSHVPVYRPAPPALAHNLRDLADVDEDGLGVGVIDMAFGEHGQDPADLEVFGLDRLAPFGDKAKPLRPAGALQ